MTTRSSSRGLIGGVADEILPPRKLSETDLQHPNASCISLRLPEPCDHCLGWKGTVKGSEDQDGLAERAKRFKCRQWWNEGDQLLKKRKPPVARADTIRRHIALSTHASLREMMPRIRKWKKRKNPQLKARTTMRTRF